jgi:hypothetical protein
MTLVILGRLDGFNPPCWYEFPTAAAAERFAAAARRRHPGRAVSVQDPLSELESLP